MKPMLMEGPLSKCVYVVTRYKIIDAEKGIYEAQTKYDVTDQFEALAARRAATASASASATGEDAR